MPPAITPTTTSVEKNSNESLRRSSRVSSKPNSFASTTKSPSSKASDSTLHPRHHQAKKNGTKTNSEKPKKKTGSKKSDQSLTDKAATKTATTQVSSSAVDRSSGDNGKHLNSGDEALNDEEHGPSASKKAKKEAKILDEESNQKAEHHSMESSFKERWVVGDKLSEGIILVTEDEKTVDILEAVKEKGAIIFIYPKANTPGCTNQACGFRDLYQEIVNAGYQVFGLSRDSPKSQRNWKEKQNLPYTLLCDPEQKLIKLLGASKSSSTVQRSHYIIAPGGEIINVTSPASPKSGPQEALDFIKKS